MGEFMSVFSNKYLNIKIKLLFHNHYVQTKLYYKAHTWNLSQKLMKQLGFHIKLLQSLVNHLWTDDVYIRACKLLPKDG